MLADALAKLVRCHKALDLISEKRTLSENIAWAQHVRSGNEFDLDRTGTNAETCANSVGVA